MKFWELLKSDVPRPRDPVTGRLLPVGTLKNAPLNIEVKIRRLAKATDHLSPGAKELAMGLAKSNLTTEQVERLVAQHYQRVDILKGYNAILEAHRLRGRGVRAKALLRRKGEL